MRRTNLLPHGVLVAFLSLLFCLALTSAASAQDVTPAAIVSGTLSPTFVDVTSSPGTLDMTMRVTDDLSGVVDACVYYLSPTLGQTVAGCISGTLVSGDRLDGFYDSRGLRNAGLTVPMFIEGGTWTLLSAYAEDGRSNRRTYDASELLALGFPPVIEIISTLDITPAVLVSGSLSPTFVDVTSSPGSMDMTMRVTDDLSGVVDACVYYLSPTLGQTVAGCISGTLVSGDRLDGFYDSALTVPTLVEGGTWTLFSAYAEDGRSNRRTYDASELLAMGFPPVIEVISTPDITPAAIVGGSISPTFVDITTSPGTVDMTMRVTDDVAGVVDACVYYLSPTLGQPVAGCISGTLVSGDRFDGFYDSALTVPMFVEGGTWTLFSAYAEDGRGNRRTYVGAELLALGFPPTLEVIADNTPPELVEFIFSPASVDVSNGPETVTFRIRIRDPSGFAVGDFRFFSLSGRQLGTAFDAGRRISGDAADGIYEIPIEIPQFIEGGTWHLASFYLASNHASVTLSEADLIARGFPTELHIVSVPEDNTPPVLAEFTFSPTQINISSGPQTVTFRVRITDDLSGFAVGDFRFFSPSGHQFGTAFDAGRRISGDAKDGVYEIPLEVQQSAETGTWRLLTFYVADNWNSIYLSEADLIARGFPTELFITLNGQPVAKAGADQSLTCVQPSGTPATLDGSASEDPDGDTLRYTWINEIGEVVGTTASITLSLPLGSHTFTLTVDDGNGGTSSDTVMVFVGVGVEGLLPPLTSLVPEGQFVPVPDHAFKQGSTLPLKLRMYCGGSLLTDTDVAPPRIVALIKSGDPIDLATVDVDAGEANDNGTLFRFSDGNWIYNLSTKALASGTYVIAIGLPDSRRFDAGFVLR